MRLSRFVSCLILALVVCAGVAHAEPSDPALSVLSARPPEGWHPVEHDAYVDLGAFVDCVTWQYAVRDGDTLGEVAQRELGSARRYREIVALNPGLNPRRLYRGTRLTMPPRSNGCEADSPRYVFFAWTPSANGWSAPRRLADERLHRVSHGSRLFAVPVGRLGGVCSASGTERLCERALAKDPMVARSGVMNLKARLPDSDPAMRLVTHWKVVGVADGRVKLKRTAYARYDAEGRRVEAPAAPSEAGTTALQILAFLLMVASIGFAVARTQRRRNEAAAQDDAYEKSEYEYDGESEYEEDDDAYEDEGYEDDDEA